MRNLDNDENIQTSAVDCSYTSITDLKNDKSYEKSKFTLFHNNIRSLPKNYDKLSYTLSLLDFNISCVMLTETNLNEQSRNLYNLLGYSNYNLIRDNKMRGGVSIFLY